LTTQHLQQSWLFQYSFKPSEGTQRPIDYLAFPGF